MAILLLFAVAWADEPQGRHPIIPPGDSAPWCATGRVWTGPLRVRVVCDGSPVEGIEVVLESGIGCTTDAKGIAQFQSADSTDKVRIREAGYFPFEEWVPEGDEELLVEIKAGIPVRGRVRFASGTPAAGAKIACWDDWGIRMIEERTADAQGRFVIGAVERAKPVQLIVSQPGVAPVVVRRSFLREEPELKLTLGGPGGIEGVVKPPSDVWVRFAHKHNPLRLDRMSEESEREIIEMETAFARPDAEGRYRIDGLPLPGNYVVCAGTNESAVVELSDEHPRAKVDLKTDVPNRPMRILDERGSPLKEEWVGLVGATCIESLETSEEGVIDLPPGEWLVDVDGYLLAPAAPDVRLDRGITLKGVVTYPGGKAAAEVPLFLCQPLPGGRYRAQGATTDEQGRFAMSGHIEGDAWLTAGEGEPEGPHGPDDGRIRIQKGMGELRLEIPARSPSPEPQPGNATLAGVVADAAGRPVEGATVDAKYPYDAVYTGADGAFSVPVDSLAPIVLEVSGPGLATRYVPVEKPGAAQLKIVLTPGAVVRGRVVDATGKAVPGAYIVFWRRLASGRLSAFEDWKPETDSAGRFEIRLPPGSYHARFYDMAFSHARIPGPDVTVGEGEAKNLEIRLP